MITQKTVSELAILARMRLGAKECASLQRDLETILEYVQTLDKFDTTGLEPISHITGFENMTRDDEVREMTAGAQELIDAFSSRKERWARVPKIIERDTV